MLRSTADLYQNWVHFVNKNNLDWDFLELSKHCAFCQKLDFATYFILSMMYLSGISPSWPRTEPFHQSLETCLKSTMVSPLWKLTSRVERALKSYNAWATNVSGSAKEKKNYVKYSGKLKGWLFCSDLKYSGKLKGQLFCFDVKYSGKLKG